MEKGLCDLADANPEKLQVWIVRPSGILSADAGMVRKMAGKLFGAIMVDQLAQDMLRIVADGHADQIVENETLLSM